jgi:hypothetical protein
LPDSLRDTATAEALQGHCRSRPRRAHRNRATPRLRARLSSNEIRNAHDGIRLTEKSPYKFWPIGATVFDGRSRSVVIIWAMARADGSLHGRSWLVVADSARMHETLGFKR